MEFKTAKSYLEYRMNDSGINCYLKDSQVAEQLKNLHEQERQAELDHKNRGMDMGMD
jgi:hypothetical protein